MFFFRSISSVRPSTYSLPAPAVPGFVEPGPDLVKHETDSESDDVDMPDDESSDCAQESTPHASRQGGGATMQSGAPFHCPDSSQSRKNSAKRKKQKLFRKASLAALAQLTAASTPQDKEMSVSVASQSCVNIFEPQLLCIQDTPNLTPLSARREGGVATQRDSPGVVPLTSFQRRKKARDIQRIGAFLAGKAVAAQVTDPSTSQDEETSVNDASQSCIDIFKPRLPCVQDGTGSISLITPSGSGSVKLEPGIEVRHPSHPDHDMGIPDQGLGPGHHLAIPDQILISEPSSCVEPQEQTPPALRPKGDLPTSIVLPETRKAKRIKNPKQQLRNWRRLQAKIARQDAEAAAKLAAASTSQDEVTSANEASQSCVNIFEPRLPSTHYWSDSIAPIGRSQLGPDPHCHQGPVFCSPPAPAVPGLQGPAPDVAEHGTDSESDYVDVPGMDLLSRGRARN